MAHKGKTQHPHVRSVILGYVTMLWVFSVIFLAGGDIFTGARHNVALLGNVIGISASIPDNEFNSLARQLTEKEQQLDARAQALSAREQSLLSELDSRQKDRMRMVYAYLFGFTIVLLALVIVNYYLDYHRQTRVG